MRALALGIAVAVIVYAATGGQIILLPRLFGIPLGLLTLRKRQQLAPLTHRRRR